MLFIAVKKQFQGKKNHTKPKIPPPTPNKTKQITMKLRPSVVPPPLFFLLLNYRNSSFIRGPLHIVLWQSKKPSGCLFLVKIIWDWVHNEAEAKTIFLIAWWVNWMVEFTLFHCSIYSYQFVVCWRPLGLDIPANVTWLIILLHFALQTRISHRNYSWSFLYGLVSLCLSPIFCLTATVEFI